MTAILYSFRRCPYAMRVILRDKPQEMLEASPKGTVPVYIKEDGNVIEESLDLLNWALNQNDPLGWLDCDIEKANSLIKANDTDFKHHLDRYKYAARRYKPKPPPRSRKAHSKLRNLVKRWALSVG